MYKQYEKLTSIKLVKKRQVLNGFNGLIVPEGVRCVGPLRLISELVGENIILSSYIGLITSNPYGWSLT